MDSHISGIPEEEVRVKWNMDFSKFLSKERCGNIVGTPSLCFLFLTLPSCSSVTSSYFSENYMGNKAVQNVLGQE